MNTKIEQNYNSEGVDLNIYTIRRDEEIEFYADRLEYLKECSHTEYKQITRLINLFFILQYDVTDCENEVKNWLIRDIALSTNTEGIKNLKYLLNKHYAILQKDKKL